MILSLHRMLSYVECYVIENCFLKCSCNHLNILIISIPYKIQSIYQETEICCESPSLLGRRSAIIAGLQLLTSGGGGGRGLAVDSVRSG